MLKAGMDLKEQWKKTTNINEEKYIEIEARTAKMRLGEKRVQWLIEHSTSNQLLWYIGSEVDASACKRAVFLPTRRRKLSILRTINFGQ